MLQFKRPFSDEEFGFYLAGLFSSDGIFSEKQLEITFHSSDISLAYYIKKKIGFGYINKVKNNERSETKL